MASLQAIFTIFYYVFDDVLVHVSVLSTTRIIWSAVTTKLSIGTLLQAMNAVTESVTDEAGGESTALNHIDAADTALANSQIGRAHV